MSKRDLELPYGWALAIVFILFAQGCMSKGDASSFMEGDDAHKKCYGHSYGREGLKKDEVKALLWCEKGHKQGKLSSSVLLAEAYYYGRGVPVDLHRATELYEHAATYGHSHAQYMVAREVFGVLSESPEKLAVDDLIRGLDYLKKAAANGHEDAQRMLKLVEKTPSEMNN